MSATRDFLGRRIWELRVGRTVFRLWFDANGWWRPYAYRVVGNFCAGWLGARLMTLKEWPDA